MGNVYVCTVLWNKDIHIKKRTTYFKISWHSFLYETSLLILFTFDFFNCILATFFIVVVAIYFLFAFQRITTTILQFYIYTCRVEKWTKKALYAYNVHKQRIREKKETLLALSHDCIWNPLGKWIIVFFSSSSLCVNYAVSVAWTRKNKLMGERERKKDSEWALFSLKCKRNDILQGCTYERCDSIEFVFYLHSIPRSLLLQLFDYHIHTMHLLHIAISISYTHTKLYCFSCWNIISAHFPSCQSCKQSGSRTGKDENATNENKKRKQQWRLPLSGNGVRCNHTSKPTDIDCLVSSHEIVLWREMPSFRIRITRNERKEWRWRERESEKKKTKVEKSGSIWSNSRLNFEFRFVLFHLVDVLSFRSMWNNVANTTVFFSFASFIIFTLPQCNVAFEKFIRSRSVCVCVCGG